MGKLKISRGFTGEGFTYPVSTKPEGAERVKVNGGHVVAIDREMMDGLDELWAGLFELATRIAKETGYDEVTFTEIVFTAARYRGKAE